MTMMLRRKRQEASLVTVAAESAELSERTIGCRRMQGRVHFSKAARSAESVIVREYQGKRHAARSANQRHAVSSHICGWLGIHQESSSRVVGISRTVGVASSRGDAPIPPP